MRCVESTCLDEVKKRRYFYCFSLFNPKTPGESTLRVYSQMYSSQFMSHVASSLTLQEKTAPKLKKNT